MAEGEPVCLEHPTSPLCLASCSLSTDSKIPTARTQSKFERERTSVLYVLLFANLIEIREYYPQNIMHDKRVQKGNTYAAMVIPAGAYPDTFGSTGKDATSKTQTMKSTFKQVNKVRKKVHFFNLTVTAILTCFRMEK